MDVIGLFLEVFEALELNEEAIELTALLLCHETFIKRKGRSRTGEKELGETMRKDEDEVENEGE